MGRKPRIEYDGAIYPRRKFLIYDFSQERNISQKDVFQAALVEFFRKYGYKQEVTTTLKI